MQKGVLVFTFCVLLNEVSPKVPINKDHLTNKKAALAKQFGPHFPKWGDLASYTKETKANQDKTKSLINLLKVVSAKEIDVPDTTIIGNITIKNATIEVDDNYVISNRSVEVTSKFNHTFAKNTNEETSNNTVLPIIAKLINKTANVTVNKTKKKYLANETIGGRLASMKLNTTIEKPKAPELNAPTMIPIFRAMQTNARNVVQPISSELIRQDKNDQRQMKSQHSDPNSNSLNPHMNNVHNSLNQYPGNKMVGFEINSNNAFPINTILNQNDHRQPTNYINGHNNSKTVLEYTDSSNYNYPHTEITLAGKEMNIIQAPGQNNFNTEQNIFNPTNLNGIYLMNAALDQNGVKQDQNVWIPNHTNVGRNAFDSSNVNVDENKLNPSSPNLNPLNPIETNFNQNGFYSNIPNQNGLYSNIPNQNQLNTVSTTAFSPNDLNPSNPKQSGFSSIILTQNGFNPSNINQYEITQNGFIANNANMLQAGLNSGSINTISSDGNIISSQNGVTVETINLDQNRFLRAPSNAAQISPFPDTLIVNNGLPPSNINLDQNVIYPNQELLYQMGFNPNGIHPKPEINDKNLNLGNDGLNLNTKTYLEIFKSQNNNNVNLESTGTYPTNNDQQSQQFINTNNIHNVQKSNVIPVNVIPSNNFPSISNDYLNNRVNTIYPERSEPNVMPKMTVNLEAYTQREAHSKIHSNAQATGFTIPCLKASDVLEDLYQTSQVAKPITNSITEKPVINLQCEKPILREEDKNDDESVAIVFKPKNISLLKFYGDLLKKITLTVLVPYHISKLTTQTTN